MRLVPSCRTPLRRCDRRPHPVSAPPPMRQCARPFAWGKYNLTSSSLQAMVGNNPVQVYRRLLPVETLQIAEVFNKTGTTLIRLPGSNHLVEGGVKAPPSVIFRRTF